MQQVAEHCNRYFTSFDKKLQIITPLTKEYFSGFLRDPNQNSFLIQPTTAEEVKSNIMTLAGSKSTGPNSILTILLKQNRSTVSSKLINFLIE